MLKGEYMLLLDNSFCERYFYSHENSPEITHEAWNMVIDNIEKELPGFSNDYDLIRTSMSLFESIGGKRLLEAIIGGKRLLEAIRGCFPTSADLLMPYDKERLDAFPEKAVSFLDEKISCTFQNLIECFKANLSPSVIIGKIEEKMRKEERHPSAHVLNVFLSDCKEDLINKGKDSNTFQRLCADLAWHRLTIHRRWYSTENDPQFEIMKNSEELFKFDEIAFTKRLIAYYLSYIRANHYLPGTSLFIRYAKLKNAQKSNGKYSEKDEVLSTYAEREGLDPYLTEYACTGFYDSSDSRRKKVVLLTCDAKRRENDVKNYVDAKKRINEECERLGISKQDFVPGYIIVVNNDHTVSIINTKDYL